ncbi:MAG: hypothetical protein ABI867_43280 [Kofleriaceae bacterium]
MRALVLIALTACGGTGGPPARLVEVGTLPDTFELFDPRALAFDTDNSVVLADLSSLRRLIGDRFDVISNTQIFASGTFGIHTDGTLLVSAQQSVIVGIVTGNTVANIAPPPPVQGIHPVGTPAGSIYLESEFGGQRFLLVSGVWAETTLDLSRTLRLPDGRMLAIIDGDIVEVGAGDAITPIISCAEFGGAQCGNLTLGGVDAAGTLYMAGGVAAFQMLDAGGGVLREASLPGNLVATQIVAGAAMIVVVGVDPDRDNEASVWLVEPGGDDIQRIATLVGRQRLLADRTGTAYLAGNSKLQAVTIE